MDFDGEVFVFGNLVEVENRFFVGDVFRGRFCSGLFGGRFYDGLGFRFNDRFCGRCGFRRGRFRRGGVIKRVFDREFRPEFVFDGGEELLELFLRFGNFFALRLDGVVQLLFRRR